MKVRNILGIAIALAMAVVLVFFGLRFLRRDPSPWKETDIDAHAPNLSSSGLSPDGSLVATLNSEEQIDPAGGDNFRTNLVIRNTQSSETVASVALPDVHTGPPPFHSWQPRSSSAQFCNRGKYLLAFDRGDSVHVLDTLSWHEKVALHPFLNIAAASAYSGGSNDIHSACSANAAIVIFELTTRAQNFATRTTRIYDLDSDQLLTDTTEDSHEDQVMDIAASPSGLNGAILLERNLSGGPIPRATELVIMDLKTRSVSKRIRVGDFGSQIAFAGESAIAVASDPEPSAGHRLSIQLWDIQSGTPGATFADPQAGASTAVGVSADGRVVMAYTGKENFCGSCPEEFKGTLQIEDARFTLWDRSTGKRIAQSPKLKVIKTAAKFLDLDPRDPKQSLRPLLQLNQSGNAVLVSRPGWSEPLQVFTLR